MWMTCPLPGSRSGRCRSCRESLFDGIQHGPQDVELELQDLQRALLLLTRPEVIEGHRETVLHIALRERDARAEVGEASRVDPWIVLWPRREPVAMDLRREDLGERRAHRFLPRRTAREIHIRVDGKAHARHDVFERP